MACSTVLETSHFPLLFSSGVPASLIENGLDYVAQKSDGRSLVHYRELKVQWKGVRKDQLEAGRVIIRKPWKNCFRETESTAREGMFQMFVS